MTDRLAPFRSLLKNLSVRESGKLLQKSLWGFADHLLAAGTQFITLVLLARALSPGELGLYSLAYTGLLLAESIQLAVVLQPYTMLGAVRTGIQNIRYTTDTGWMQIGLTAIMMVLAIVSAAIALATGHWMAPALFAFAPAIVGVQLHEFIRRALYVHSEVTKVFWNDVITCGLHLITLVALWQTGTLTAVWAIASLAASTIVGSLHGIWLIRDHLDGRLTRDDLREHLTLNWNFGKWLLGANLMYWTSVHLFPILIAGFISITIAGILRAIQTIFGPLNILFVTLEPMFGPRAAQAYDAGGTAALRTYVTRVQLFFTTCVGAYCLLVALFSEQILFHVYGPQYVGHGWLVVTVAIVTLGTSMSGPFVLGLKTLKATNAVFRVNVITGLFTLTIGVMVIYLWGMTGLSIGLIGTSVIFLGLSWHAYQDRVHEPAHHDPGVHAPVPSGR